MNHSRRATILCSQDAFANGVKPREIKAHLTTRGYDVSIFDSSRLSRAGTNGAAQFLPALHAGKLYLYTLECILTASSFVNKPFNRLCNSLFLLPVLKIRAHLLHNILRQHTPYDLIICESNFDQGIVREPRLATNQILDLPAPFAEELYFGKLLSKRAYDRLNAYEQNNYAAADYLSFHWHTYTDYVKANKYSGANYINLSYGTHPKGITASFSEHPRIAFLGYLQGYWVNLPLLEMLCTENPCIDVYGGPKPPEGSNIRYKGYAPSTDVLAKYQFGLVTISQDELRKNSFSSKHLEYVSYGLPVLTPDWRRDSLLDDSSIYYNVDTFKSLVAEASIKKNWERLHKNALRDTEKLSWDNALACLDSL